MMSDLSAAQVIAAKFLELEADPMDDPGSDENLADVIANIALAALAAAGYEVVKVSDPDETYMVTGGEIAENGEWYAYVRVPQALLDGVMLGDFPTLGPAIAQGLLAAARHAEADQ